MRILIIEDDTALASFIRKGLEAEHYAVDTAFTGDHGCGVAMEFDIDLLILDLNLPGIDGISILKSFRQRKASVPVMVLTARAAVEDRVRCLDFGADDYLVKPFSFVELSARVRALLRRSHLPSESVLTVRDLRLDRVERKVERSGRAIELTTKEFALLEYLMRNAGRRVTRAMIIEHVNEFWLHRALRYLVGPVIEMQEPGSAVTVLLEDHRFGSVVSVHSLSFPQFTGHRPDERKCASHLLQARLGIAQCVFESAGASLELYQGEHPGFAIRIPRPQALTQRMSA